MLQQAAREDVHGREEARSERGMGVGGGVSKGVRGSGRANGVG